jgi:acyl-CoA reductase-like NAD-dependent aldehyde dehydrogenase
VDARGRAVRVRPLVVGVTDDMEIAGEETSGPVLPLRGREGSASRVGRVGGRSAMERLTELKTVVIRLED